MSTLPDELDSQSTNVIQYTRVGLHHILGKYIADELIRWRFVCYVQNKVDDIYLIYHVC